MAVNSYQDVLDQLKQFEPYINEDIHKFLGGKDIVDEFGNDMFDETVTGVAEYINRHLDNRINEHEFDDAGFTLTSMSPADQIAIAKAIVYQLNYIQLNGDIMEWVPEGGSTGDLSRSHEEEYQTQERRALAPKADDVLVKRKLSTNLYGLQNRTGRIPVENSVPLYVNEDVK